MEGIEVANGLLTILPLMSWCCDVTIYPHIGWFYYRQDVTTALDEYVHSDDGFYSWELLATYRYENLSCTLHVVNMTSQKWMDGKKLCHCGYV